MARIRDILGGLTCAAVVAVVLIAIMGTVSAHGTQAVRGVAISESAAANQAAARADAAILLGEDVKLKVGPRHPSRGAVLAEKSVGSLARPASSYKFEDLAVTRLVSDGKPTSGFTSYYRLNRALPFAPRGKFEGEEEGGPRLYAAYVSVDGAYEEGGTEAIGDAGNDAGRHCYAETIAVHAPEHQPRIGEVVNVSLVVKGRRLLTARTRVSNRKFGPTIRERDGLLVTQEALPYEKAFGCLKMSSQ